MDVNQAAEQAWDMFVGQGTVQEMMDGFDTPEEAVNSYCEDWPWSETSPDEELQEFHGYTARQLLVIHIENETE